VDHLLCAQLKLVSCALAVDQKVFASLWEGFTSLWSFGVRFLDVDFMRINLPTVYIIYFFFTVVKGEAARTVIAMQDGGTGAGAQHGGAGRGPTSFLSCHRTSMWAPREGDFLVSNFHPGAIPGNLVRNDFWR
jgi:hypothetical protein